MTRSRPWTLMAVTAAVALAACADDSGTRIDIAGGTLPTTALTVAPTSTTVAAPVTSVATVARVARITTIPRPTTTRPPRPRLVTEQDWVPFATVGELTLRYPSRRIERVGFHESNNDGARILEMLPTTIRPVTLPSRGRGTAARSAADIVSDPALEVRAPVTGKVLRSGTYVLYCKYSDDYVVIEPDVHPGWEVTLVHISGVKVAPEDRVTAGQTVLAPRPTQLPFASQVDKYRTAAPPWPHVHVEVDDPSIPDRPSAGGCD